jgi:hypothetical protein
MPPGEHLEHRFSKGGQVLQSDHDATVRRLGRWWHLPCDQDGLALILCIRHSTRYCGENLQQVFRLRLKKLWMLPVHIP